MKKIIKFFKKNRGKFKDFCISVMAGLFSGTAIGIFFNLTTQIEFIRWINLENFEVFAGIIYFIGTLLILEFFYWIGKIFIVGILKDNKRFLSFHLNFISGMYSSIMAFLLVLYNNQSTIRNTIALLGILSFFPLAYFTIKKKWPKNSQNFRDI